MQPNQRVMVTITNRQAVRLNRVTDETGVSRSAVLSIALSDYLAKWEREHAIRPDGDVCEICEEPATCGYIDRAGVRHVFCDEHGDMTVLSAL